MKSYASIDRGEGKYTVLELELIDTQTSEMISFKDKETVMLDVLTDEIITSVGEISEGDILVIEHENGNLISIYNKDDEEKQRRIELLNTILNNT